jgi:hypothetical protein
MTEGIRMGIFFFALAFAMSQLEIQIEGKIPWAGALPCWRRATSFKELTGYHLWMGILIITIFAYPYALGKMHLERASVLEWISGILLGIFLFEDFLWNAVHPSQEFGFRVYLGREKQYPSIGGIYFSFIPLDYLLWAVLSLLFFRFSGGETRVWLQAVATMVFLAVITVPVMQVINRMTGARERYSKYVEEHNFQAIFKQRLRNKQKTRDVVAMLFGT